jgi:hypothetical protein
MSAVPAQNFCKKPHAYTESRCAVAVSSQPDRFEYESTGRPKCSATTAPKPCSSDWDADGGAQRSHITRHVSQHAIPRVLASSRFSAVRVRRLLAHTGFYEVIPLSPDPGVTAVTAHLPNPAAYCALTVPHWRGTHGRSGPSIGNRVFPRPVAQEASKWVGPRRS